MMLAIRQLRLTLLWFFKTVYPFYSMLSFSGLARLTEIPGHPTWIQNDYQTIRLSVLMLAWSASVELFHTIAITWPLVSFDFRRRFWWRPQPAITPLPKPIASALAIALASISVCPPQNLVPPPKWASSRLSDPSPMMKLTVSLKLSRHKKPSLTISAQLMQFLSPSHTRAFQ